MKPFIVSFATVASIIGLALTTSIPGWARAVIAVVGIICFIVLLADDVASKKVNERVCCSDAEIKSAMKDIIRTQGKVCIMSRDLSWVDTEVEQCILTKKGSMLIFVEGPTELTKRLHKFGVRIMYYGHLHFEPSSRFTVIKYPRDPQVAIANTKYSVRKRRNFKHTIYETGGNNCKQDKWINSLACDMIKLCELVCEEATND
jgi:hypothetical protein